MTIPGSWKIASRAGVIATALAAAIALATTASASTFVSTAKSGYVANLSSAPQSLKTTFKVPALACTSTDSAMEAGAFLGIGHNQSGGAILMQCVSGSASYSAETILNGTRTVQPIVMVSAGDVVQVIILQTVTPNGTVETITVHDVTSKTKFTTPPAPASNATTTLFGIESVNSGATKMPIPNFGQIRFLSYINNQPLGDWNPDAYELVGPTSNAILVSTGPLNTKAGGNAFTETFQQSS